MSEQLEPFRAWVAVVPRGAPDMPTVSTSFEYSLNRWKRARWQNYFTAEQLSGNTYPENPELAAWSFALHDGWRIVEVEVREVEK